ncbi:polyphosphate kinase 1 [Proteobacteria bacterium 005FR1]|nr:polyphosphate kinase 1 [Proteobacteria bacterium 005FR1]
MSDTLSSEYSVQIGENPTTKVSGTAPDPEFIAKELSWLSFNERVLQEAANEDVPVIQRLRYLGIFSNNLDEFFRVRVADVSRLAAFSSTPESKERYNKLLQEIQVRTRQIQNRFEQTYAQVLTALRKRKIYLVDEHQLDKQQSDYVAELFDTQVLPELDPILLDAGLPFPRLQDGCLYLAIKIRSGDQVRFGLVEVPTDRVPRFIQIPQRKGGKGKVFIVLENVIRHCIKKMFRGVIEIDRIQGYAFKLTLDAELELGEGINQSLINKVAMSLKKRQSNANLERFVYDSSMPKDLLKFLTKKLKLGKYDSTMPGGRYHNAKDFMDFPAVGPAHLEYQSLPALPVPELQQAGGNILDRLRQRDILLYYPYHAFDSTIELLKTAAIDPAVKSIHISLYRVSKNSRVVDALLSARRNHKEVTAVVELQARFDEAANIDWATQLTEGGVNVIFGVPGLKVHSKLILISRQEKAGLRYYSHIGTGNFNEKTANVYTDFSLLTYDQTIGRDLWMVFDFISFNYRQHNYKQLWVSPHTTRSGVESRIDREITHAENGLPAAITIKCNNLVDEAIIRQLYRASGAGVRVRIICRGMCSLIPGRPDQSDNIEVISIVDRFLEHPRVFIFHNKGQPEYFISSADLMTRNLDYRVEASVPINDPQLQKRIQDIIDIQWCDNTKARQVDAEQSNRIRDNRLKSKLRSQMVIYKYLKTGKLPKAVEHARKRWSKKLKAK